MAQGSGTGPVIVVRAEEHRDRTGRKGIAYYYAPDTGELHSFDGSTSAEAEQRAAHDAAESYPSATVIVEWERL